MRVFAAFLLCGCSYTTQVIQPQPDASVRDVVADAPSSPWVGRYNFLVTQRTSSCDPGAAANAQSFPVTYEIRRVGPTTFFYFDSRYGRCFYAAERETAEQITFAMTQCLDIMDDVTGQNVNISALDLRMTRIPNGVHIESVFRREYPATRQCLVDRISGDGEQVP